MDNFDKSYLAMIIILLSIGTIGAIFSWTTYNDQVMTNNNLNSELSLVHPVLTASFEDPKITIQTNTIQEFLQKAQSVNATAIYNTGSSYVVVDQSFTYAYSLTIPTPFPNFIALLAVFIGYLLATMMIGAYCIAIVMNY